MKDFVGIKDINQFDSYYSYTKPPTISVRVFEESNKSNIFIGHNSDCDYVFKGFYVGLEECRRLGEYLIELTKEPTYNISEYIGSVGAYNILDNEGEVLKLTKSQWKERLGF